MRVLLAAAPHRDTFGYSMPPPGLLRLAGELLRHGIQVELEDLALRLSAGELESGDRMADAAAEILLARARAGPLAADHVVAEHDVSVIGISVMGATLPIALAILERLRPRLPRAQLWLGGPGTTGVDAAILERFPFVDVVVRGEGEVTVPELCAALQGAHGPPCAVLDGAHGPQCTVLDGAHGPQCAALDGAHGPRGILGITWRDDLGRVRREPDREPMRDLGRLAPYAWHLLPPLSVYKLVTGAADGLVPLDSGRGCVYDCSFCTIGRYWGRRSRTLPAKMLADEVESLSAMPAAKSAYLCHDIFGANRGQALAFCEEMSRRAIDVPWEVRARADHLDRELLELMGQAGCYRVLIGVESGDAEVRARNQKGMRDDVDMLAVVDDCREAGITPILSLILGLPGEDENALRKSLDLCAAASLRAGVNVSLHLVNPQPGCGLGEEFGARSRPIEGIPPDMAFGAGETAPERALIAAHPDLFSTWSLLPLEEARLRDLHAIATTLPEVLMRYPRTFALLCASRGEDALDAYRAWRSHGRSFEGFARAANDVVIDEALLWEQALVRQASHAATPVHVAIPAHAAALAHAGTSAHATTPARSDRGWHGPRARGEILALEHDLPKICAELRAGASAHKHRQTQPQTHEHAPTALCVLPIMKTIRGRREARGVETLRISSDVARLVHELDGTESLAMLESRLPGIGVALERLAAAGLVELPVTDASSAEPIPSEPTNEMLRA